MHPDNVNLERLKTFWKMFRIINENKIGNLKKQTESRMGLNRKLLKSKQFGSKKRPM